MIFIQWMLLEFYASFVQMDVLNFMDFYLVGVTGNLFLFLNGCYWKFIDFYLMDVTGNLWICLWMLLEFYGFFKWMLLEYGNVYGCYWQFLEIYFQKSTL